ncbi:MAG: hypothetical protein GY946_27055 [bacterium]|nr:hypothetical protein [bacterium]
MSGAPDRPRIRFHADQRLDAQDLRNEAKHGIGLINLHVTGVHDTWGIANGYDLHLSARHDAVLVTPGIAYDIRGRTLFLRRPVALRLAAAGQGARRHDLVMRYRPLVLGDDCGRAVLGCGAVEETSPTFRWLRSDAPLSDPFTASAYLNLGLDIPLGRRRGNGGALVEGLRQFTQPGTLARRFTARVEAGHEIDGTMAHWRMTIDTRAADFRQTPSYQLHLEEHPLGEDSAFLSHFTTDLDLRPLVHGPFLRILAADRESLSIEVFIRPGAAFMTQSPLYQDLPLSSPVPLSWTGVEIQDRRMPPIDLDGLRYDTGELFPDPYGAFGTIMNANA